MKPLEGLKIVELGMYLAAPGVTRLLSDWGAEVIKIESLNGDAARYSGIQVRLPALPDCNIIFSIINSGKKLLSLDLKTPEGMEVMQKLLSDLLSSGRMAGDGLCRIWYCHHCLAGLCERSGFGRNPAFCRIGGAALFWLRGFFGAVADSHRAVRSAESDSHPLLSGRKTKLQCCGPMGLLSVLSGPLAGPVGDSDFGDTAIMKKILPEASLPAVFCSIRR